jgi:hypothetical protein
MTGESLPGTRRHGLGRLHLQRHDGLTGFNQASAEFIVAARGGEIAGGPQPD